VNLFVRLYPRSWRERYGDELSALLEDRPPGPADALDLLLGAFDAHLHRRAVGVRPTVGTDTQTLPRLGAQAAMAAGVLWIITFAMALTDDPALTNALMTLLSIDLTLLVLALAGMSAGRARFHGATVWAALLLPLAGVVLLMGGAVTQLVVSDHRLVGELTPYAFWMGGMVLVLVGTVVLGTVATARGALPRWAAGILGVGAVIQLLTVLATDHVRDEWLMLVGALAFGLAWTSVGLLAAHSGRYRVVDQL
jgi:hypothetical protein